MDALKKCWKECPYNMQSHSYGYIFFFKSPVWKFYVLLSPQNIFMSHHCIFTISIPPKPQNFSIVIVANSQGWKKSCIHPANYVLEIEKKIGSWEEALLRILASRPLEKSINLKALLLLRFLGSPASSFLQRRQAISGGRSHLSPACIAKGKKSVSHTLGNRHSFRKH